MASASGGTALVQSAVTARTMDLLERVLDGYRPRDFGIRLWDGTIRPADPGVESRFTLVLTHPGALRAMLWPPHQLSMAEAYIYGDVDVEGDLEAVFPLADHLLLGRPPGLADKTRLAARLLRLPAARTPREGRVDARLGGRRSSLARARQAVSYHYDLSNEFFSLFLDSRLVYTCAVFADEHEDLETAQLRKLDLICRKLRLRRGERLLDVGCGWGGLLMYAAERYGVEAVGVTLSREQAELARERIRAAGLGKQVRIEVCDYRELDEPGSFDKVVSVCMFEQVPEELLPGFFAHARRMLTCGGVFLNQGLAANVDLHTRLGRRGPSFMSRYVFPDGDVVPVSTALRAAELAGLEVRDVESFREHYPLTLRHWVRRLEARREEARREVGEAAYRIWRLYMAGAAYSFERNRLNLYQALFAKSEGRPSGLQKTRDDWYERRRARHDRPAPASFSRRRRGAVKR